MMLTVLLLWLAACVECLPPLLRFCIAAAFGVRQILVAMLIIFFGAFWVFGAYHLVVFFFDAFGRPTIEPRRRSVRKSEIPVALLYTTRNDFDSIALSSCLDQDYAAFHVFVLDDSTETECSRAIDAFAGTAIGKITIVRRPNKLGGKAANLNYALSRVVRQFPYFAVVDADAVLSPSFISSLLPRLLSDPALAYVQASCRARTDLLTSFGSIVAPSLNLMWTCYIPYRAKYGFVPFLGKGALIRREAWVKVGGFPELVAEDVGFSLATREAGYRGKYVDTPLVWEGLPKSYDAFVAQQSKYAVGALELFLKGGKLLYWGKHLAWFERLDLMLLLAGNVLPAVSFSFLLFSGLVIPAQFYDLHRWAPWPTALPGVLFPLPSTEFSRLIGWPLRIVSIVSVLAPVLNVIRADCRSIISRGAFITQSSVAYLSSLPRVMSRTVSYVILGNREFASTGDRTLTAQATSVGLLCLLGVMLIAALPTINLQMGSVVYAAIVTRGTSWEQRPFRTGVVPFVLFVLSLAVFALAGASQPAGPTSAFPIHF